MIERGLESEARSLIKMNHLKPLQTLGYKEWIPYWKGNCDIENVTSEIKKKFEKVC
jgi:tRNA A37 N6-isopentenylltransferase MiaA